MRAVDIPVIGIGGISTPDDALEFLMAGAKAIENGTTTLVRPGTAEDVLAKYQGLHEGQQHTKYRGFAAAGIRFLAYAP